MRFSTLVLREQTLLNTLTETPSPANLPFSLSDNSLLSDMPREGSCMSERGVLGHLAHSKGAGGTNLSCISSPAAPVLIGLLCLIKGSSRILAQSCLYPDGFGFIPAASL